MALRAFLPANWVCFTGLDRPLGRGAMALRFSRLAEGRAGLRAFCLWEDMVLRVIGVFLVWWVGGILWRLGMQGRHSLSIPYKVSEGAVPSLPSSCSFSASGSSLSTICLKI